MYNQKNNFENKSENVNNNVLCKKYMHYIRNCKVLDETMIHNIRSMSNEEKINIIISLNEVVKNLNYLLDES